MPNTSFRSSLGLLLAFAAIKLIVQIAFTRIGLAAGYGIFRDELYYLMCGRFLDWGYVDHAPLVALQARLAVAFFGDSVTGIRMFSALAGASTVFLTGAIAWSLGGSRIAQALAMLAALVAPQSLALDGYLSMNSCEPTFWLTAVFALTRLARGGSLTWWLLFGVAGGLGIENKPSIIAFLFSLLVGLLLTPQRQLLASRWCLTAVGLIAALALPFALWQLTHDLAMLEFIHNGRVEGKNAALPPVAFITQQVLSMHPLSLPLWVGGVIWLWRNPPFRALAIAFVVFFPLMFALHAKTYYLAPVYPMLFAAGAQWCSTLLQRRTTAWLVPTWAALLLITGAVFAPLGLPLLAPETFIRYASSLGLRGGETETLAQGPLPQFFADRFGWQPLADEMTRVYRALSPDDQAKAGIFCSNYGEAGAINVLAQRDARLPFATSGHNTYWLWGPHGYSGEVMLLVVAADAESELRKIYDSVERVGELNVQYSMPYEHRPIFLCRHRKANFTAEWPQMKHFI